MKRKIAWFCLPIILCAILLTYPVNREAVVPDQIPEVYYTFHGHEITAEELEDNDIIQH
jgi:hypothetical protein